MLVKCGSCGKEFEVSEYEVKRGRGKYCSYKCTGKATGSANAKKKDMTGMNNPNWKGGISNQWSRYAREAEKRSPEKARARQMVRDAVKSGKLFRKPCEVCGNPKSEAHHDDYSKPLEVRWLCRRDHRAHHSLR